MFYDLHYIGSALKQARKKSHLTQGEVALRSGISRATINALENFKARDVNVNTLTLIFGVFEDGQKESVVRVEGSNVQPQFDFPYVWSNPHPTDEILIVKVLERALFRDVLHLCRHYGVLRVTKVFYGSTLKDDALLVQTITRMLTNIQKGFAHA